MNETQTRNRLVAAPSGSVAQHPMTQQNDIIHMPSHTANTQHLTEDSTAESSAIVMEMGVVVPTLNEGENIVPLLQGITGADERLHVIIVDDGSRDGTAQKARDFGDKLAATNGGVQRVHLVNRGRKLGFASAVQDGMRFALQHGAQRILQMDADFSHDPKYLPAMLQKSRDCELVLGSRYIRGGGTRNWTLDRKILSGGANLLVRLLLNLPAHNCTGGFRCWKRELLEACGILDLRVEGYAFQFLTLDLARRRGARVGEVPIIFVDRQLGKSKMSRHIIVEAGRVLASMWWRRVTGR